MASAFHVKLHCPFCDEDTLHVDNAPEFRCLGCGKTYEWADAGHPRELPICSGPPADFERFRTAVAP
jgi:hypothetical protein